MYVNVCMFVVNVVYDCETFVFGINRMLLCIYVKLCVFGLSRMLFCVYLYLVYMWYMYVKVCEFHVLMYYVKLCGFLMIEKINK